MRLKVENIFLVFFYLLVLLFPHIVVVVFFYFIIILISKFKHKKFKIRRTKSYKVLNLKLARN